MNQADAIIGIVAGGALITVSFFAKTFYAGKGLYGSSTRTISPWKGRLLFRAVGGTMVLFGLNYLFTHH
jgi:hypothetical protein